MNGLKNIKNNLKKGALFRKFFLYTALVILVCVAVLGLVLMIFTASQWWNEKINSLTKNAKYIVSAVVDSESSLDDFESEYQKNISSVLEIMTNATDSDYFITDSSGKIIICKDSFENDGVENCDVHGTMHIPDSYMAKAVKNGFSNYATDDVFGLGKFVVAVPISIDGEVCGAAFAVEDAIEGLLPYILSILKTFIITATVGLFLSFTLVYFACKKITTPINKMQEVTKHFAKGEFEYRADETYKEEYLNDFARSLNKMADELAVEEEAQKSFVANVSHELKTPMTTIGGFIDGILDGTIPKEKQESYLHIVSNEVKRLARMVVAMLNLSKIEAGEVSLAPTKYDISSQIFETLLSFETRINEKKIQIEGFEEMGSVTINADKDLIQQVIYNLFDNAVKFTPEGGKISVFAKNENGKTNVRICNTGTGVSNEEISRIFERFYKVDKSRSFDVKGVGLGLYIVKTIINMHDGEIKAKSVEGEYIEFSFVIPNETEF